MAVTRESATRAQFKEAKALFDAGRLAESRAALQAARQTTRWGSVADADGQCVCPAETSWSDAQSACVGVTAGGSGSGSGSGDICDQIQQQAMVYGQRMQGYQGQFMSADSQAAQQQIACAMLGDSRHLFNLLIEGERAGCASQGNFAQGLSQIEQIYGQVCAGGSGSYGGGEVYEGDSYSPCTGTILGQGECD